jgi:hypothetical protein
MFDERVAVCPRHVVEVLERAFLETYGLPLKAILANEDLALNSYRRAVGAAAFYALRRSVATFSTVIR